MPESTVERLDRTHRQLWQHMQTEWMPYWHLLASVGAPSSPIYLNSTGGSSGGTTARRNGRRNSTLLSTVAVRALNILGPGLLQGLASPSRPWFQGGTTRVGLMEDAANRQWVHDWADALLGTMDRTNFYSAFEKLLKTSAQFGTGTMSILEDDERLYRCVDHPPGSYALSQNDRNVLDTFTREREMTLRQIVAAWGVDNLPAKLRVTWGQPNCNREQLVKVCHTIMPNGSLMQDGFGPAGMPYHEVYWYPGGSHTGAVADVATTGGTYLSETGAPKAQKPNGQDDAIFHLGGFREFPVISHRWSRTAEEVYGSECPGMTALPDVFTLQDIRRDILNASKQKNNPALNAATSLENKQKTLLSGGVNHGGVSADGRPLLQPLYTNPQSLAELRDIEREISSEVEEAYLKPVFLAFLGDDRAQPQTAREASEKVRERLSILGPIQEGVADDVLDKAIDRISNIAVRASLADWAAGRDGVLPLPPEALMGETIDVHYVSEVAQAQRMLGLENLDRLGSTVLGLGGVIPDALDKLDTDEFLEEYADKLSTAPKLMRESRVAAQMRAQRAKQQAAMAAADAAPGVAKAARDFQEVEQNAEQPQPRARLLA